MSIHCIFFIRIYFSSASKQNILLAYKPASGKMSSSQFFPSLYALGGTFNSGRQKELWPKHVVCDDSIYEEKKNIWKTLPLPFWKCNRSKAYIFTVVVILSTDLKKNKANANKIGQWRGTKQNHECLLKLLKKYTMCQCNTLFMQIKDNGLTNSQQKELRLFQYDQIPYRTKCFRVRSVFKNLSRNKIQTKKLG